MLAGQSQRDGSLESVNRSPTSKSPSPKRDVHGSPPPSTNAAFQSNEMNRSAYIRPNSTLGNSALKAIRYVSTAGKAGSPSRSSSMLLTDKFQNPYTHSQAQIRRPDSRTEASQGSLRPVRVMARPGTSCSVLPQMKLDSFNSSQPYIKLDEGVFLPARQTESRRMINTFCSQNPSHLSGKQ